LPHHLLSIVVQASISYIYAHHHHHHGARITNARTKNYYYYYYYYYIIKKTSCKFLRVYAEVKRTCNNFNSRHRS
jgi:hypothetical protein